MNENDAVSVDEIVVGDNDNLAAMTAALVDADLLALLTDVPGVYDRDPDLDPAARVVPRASSADELRALCFGKKEIVSTGGMETKLEAAERAGAEQHSPVELRFAREKLDEARKGMEVKQYDKSIYLIEQSEINSELAIEKSRTAEVRARVTELARENEILREDFSATFGEDFR